MHATRAALYGGVLADSVGQVIQVNLPAPRPGDEGLAAGRVRWLPHRNHVFTGRQALLDRIDRCLHASPAEDTGGNGVVALVGMGGAGKTQLALEYAHRQAGRYGVAWWLDADRPVTLAERLMTLAARMGIIGVDQDTAVAALWRALSAREDWLLVYDNVDDVRTLDRMLPPPGGRVLLTGRDPALARLGTRIDVGEFHRDDSVRLLRHRCPSLSPAEADQVAEAVGDLPLALEQAGCFLQDTDLEVREYLRLLRDDPARAGSDDATVYSHPGLATIVETSRARLRDVAGPLAAALLDQFAFLAPEPLPIGSTAAPGERFGVRLGDTATTALAIRRMVQLGLLRHASRTTHTVQMHRTVQTLLRARLDPDEHRRAWLAAQQLVSTADPGDPDDPRAWSNYALLTAHVQALVQQSPGTEQADAEAFRDLTLKVLQYLDRLGQYRAGLDLGRALHTRWRAVLGPDHPDTLRLATGYFLALYGLGAYAEAQELVEDAWERQRRVLGEDHPDTLATASELTFNLYKLGRNQEGERLGRQAWLRYRHLYGDDHPDTLRAAHSLAACLFGLDRFEEARALIEDTWERRRRVFGEDHPVTLVSASNFARTLSTLGANEDARALNEDILERRRRVLGEDHPATLQSAENLAWDLSKLGREDESRALIEDTLERRRRVLGGDHPDTLSLGEDLANRLAVLGAHEAARALDEDVFERRRRILGADHPATLLSANNLACDLAGLGEEEAARTLREDTLERRRRVLGEDHPDTLQAAENLARTLHALGAHETARALEEDTSERRRRADGEHQA